MLIHFGFVIFFFYPGKQNTLCCTHTTRSKQTVNWKKPQIVFDLSIRLWFMSICDYDSDANKFKIWLCCFKSNAKNNFFLCSAIYCITIDIYDIIDSSSPDTDFFFFTFMTLFGLFLWNQHEKFIWNIFRRVTQGFKHLSDSHPTPWFLCINTFFSILFHVNNKIDNQLDWILNDTLLI